METLKIFNHPDRENLITAYHQNNTQLIKDIIQRKPDGVEIVSDDTLIFPDKEGRKILATPFGASFVESGIPNAEMHLLRLYSSNVLQQPTEKQVFDVTPFLAEIQSRLVK